MVVLDVPGKDVKSSNAGLTMQIQQLRAELAAEKAARISQEQVIAGLKAENRKLEVVRDDALRFLEETAAEDGAAISKLVNRAEQEALRADTAEAELAATRADLTACMLAAATSLKEQQEQTSEAEWMAADRATEAARLQDEAARTRVVVAQLKADAATAKAAATAAKAAMHKAARAAQKEIATMKRQLQSAVEEAVVLTNKARCAAESAAALRAELADSAAEAVALREEAEEAREAARVEAFNAKKDGLLAKARHVVAMEKIGRLEDEAKAQASRLEETRQALDVSEREKAALKAELEVESRPAKEAAEGSRRPDAVEAPETRVGVVACPASGLSKAEIDLLVRTEARESEYDGLMVMLIKGVVKFDALTTEQQTVALDEGKAEEIFARAKTDNSPSFRAWRREVVRARRA